MPCRHVHLAGPHVALELYEGVTRLEDVIAMKRTEFEEGLVDEGLRVLADLRATRLEAKWGDVGRLVEWQREHGAFHERIRTAILVDDPRDTALAMLYSQQLQEQRETQIFSTLEGALGFLGLESRELGEWEEPLRSGLQGRDANSG